MARTGLTTGPVRPPERRKLSINLPDEVATVVRDLALRHGITSTEVVRRGIALEKFFADHVDDGSKVLLEKPDGTLERVHFVFP